MTTEPLTTSLEGDMRYSLFERLRAWIELMCARPDVEVVRPLCVQATTEGEPDSPHAYPSDAAEFARSAKRLMVGFLGPEIDEERTMCSLSLSLEGVRARRWPPTSSGGWALTPDCWCRPRRPR